MTASINKNEFTFKLPEMMSYHSTWDDADYEPVFPRRRGPWLARTVARGIRKLRDSAYRRRVRNELAGMSDRELADLGISRYDIPRVFDPDFTTERARRGI